MSRIINAHHSSTWQEWERHCKRDQKRWSPVCYMSLPKRGRLWGATSMAASRRDLVLVWQAKRKNALWESFGLAWTHPSISFLWDPLSRQAIGKVGLFHARVGVFHGRRMDEFYHRWSQARGEGAEEGGVWARALLLKYDSKKAWFFRASL